MKPFLHRWAFIGLSTAVFVFFFEKAYCLPATLSLNRRREAPGSILPTRTGPAPWRGLALLLATTAVTQATTADHIREATRQHGAKIGYKAFATSIARYRLTGKMTPEGVKADKAAAAALEEDGKDAEAQAIYRLILGEHPDHPLVKEKEVNR